MSESNKVYTAEALAAMNEGKIVLNFETGESFLKYAPGDNTGIYSTEDAELDCKEYFLGLKSCTMFIIVD